MCRLHRTGSLTMWCATPLLPACTFLLSLRAVRTSGYRDGAHRTEVCSTSSLDLFDSLGKDAGGVQGLGIVSKIIHNDSAALQAQRKRRVQAVPHGQ